MLTKTYQCLEPIKHNGQRYMPPSTIELTDEEANRLLDCDAVVEVDAPEPKANPEQQANPELGQPTGDSTAADDALAEQTDKNTNQDPETNNKDGGDATPSVAENATEGANTQPEEANGVPAPAASHADAAGDGNKPVRKSGKSKAK